MEKQDTLQSIASNHCKIKPSFHTYYSAFQMKHKLQYLTKFDLSPTSYPLTQLHYLLLMQMQLNYKKFWLGFEQYRCVLI